ncbi:type I-C CRISPR-associated protein Cas5c [Saccharothrix longispora]|uniref:pre-crRNA processing endonuclease n=1 Tax=Saccharothrix longispora TaxID=33920 RepID=A0ABU1PQV9_9PSEU|nr:type I-C CRISPR-associated protein Cas5c [Saccharothrix longispora]MDR6592479.1 CRISPR-associated protein Cas5d [Saccharothrix longispora]
MPLAVQVWGPGALFTRPELKVERVSYPVMTPSAAVGVLESIFWKPEMRWRVQRIEVLRPIRQFTQRRNETTDLASLADAVSGRRRLDTAAHRVQRNAVCLRDVAYRVHAQIDLADHADKPVAAYRDQFRRRVTKGRCFTQPYLGTREFTAYFGEPDDQQPLGPDHDDDFGLMLHSVNHGTTPISFTWFDARMRGGVIEVPVHGIPARPAGEDAGEAELLSMAEGGV